MPADITGTEILQDTGEGRKMLFVSRPVFANMILADEINRTPQRPGRPAGSDARAPGYRRGVRHALEEPFFVLATQNRLRWKHYPLPEAQLDRFMFNVVMELFAGGRRGCGRHKDDFRSARAISHC